MEADSNVRPLSSANPKLSKRKMRQLAEQREAALIEKFMNVVAAEKAKVNGLTRILGKVAERFGELEFTQDELDNTDPGSMYLEQRGDIYKLRTRDDASKPVELSVVPENMPEEALDLEAMARDGVSEVKIHDS